MSESWRLNRENTPINPYHAIPFSGEKTGSDSEFGFAAYSASDAVANDIANVGEGRFGRVMVDPADPEVAIKSIPLEKFEPLEVKTLRHLQKSNTRQSDHIMRLYQATPEEVTLRLSHAEGTTLKDWSMQASWDVLVRQGTTDEYMNDLWRVVDGMWDALETLESNDAAHRDIKADNVMWTSPERESIQLIDFGLACFVERVDNRNLDRCEGGRQGFLNHVAPKLYGKLRRNQMLYLKDFQRSDWYAFGFMLAGLLMKLDLTDIPDQPSDDYFLRNRRQVLRALPATRDEIERAIMSRLPDSARESGLTQLATDLVYSGTRDAPESFLDQVRDNFANGLYRVEMSGGASMAAQLRKLYSKATLSKIASVLNIDGRSSMNESSLSRAIAKSYSKTLTKKQFQNLTKIFKMALRLEKR